MFNLEDYFADFRRNTVGYYKRFPTCYGMKDMIYADWTASGRLFKPIEYRITNKFGPFVGNTHSESSTTGSMTTKAYKLARQKIKNHVKASEDDILIITGFGMTAAVNKLQRILGLRGTKIFNNSNRPLVIITHMEHHSNYISWLECDVDVVMIPPNSKGLVDLDYLEMILHKFQNRPYKIGAFTACSNVTGITTPYHKMAKLMHLYNGICFIDICASAAYVDIDMHPIDPMEKLDGIFFSPHKFLGGPGTPGILIFDNLLYRPLAPDNPGGGTVSWTNPWGEYKYSKDIEVCEDGGTPGFLQTIKAAMCIDLKNQMKVSYMLEREHELAYILLSELSKIKNVHILQDNIKNRMGIVSFYIDNMHYNLVTKVLNDRYGIQVRGGCSCAGPYGHCLLKIDKNYSKWITDCIDEGNLFIKPGWVRISIHPMMTNREIYYITNAVNDISCNVNWFIKEYVYDKINNEFRNRNYHEDFSHLKRWLKV
jgi:selenocysteine lyase/cysteine desulfurase